MNNSVQIIVEMLNKTQSGERDVNESIKRITAQAALLSAEFLAIKYAVEQTFAGISAAINPAIDAVKEYQEGVVKTAAMITSFQGNKGDIGKNYREAKEYAEALWQAMEEVDAKTLASASDLAIITEEMLKQRVVLDINNKQQLDAFANLANAAAVIAMGYPGKEIQLRQEIRSLMAGQVDQNSQLSQQLNSMVGGGLKEQVALHKKSGDLVEWMGGLLSGYAAATGDIQEMWSTITSTIDTLVKQVLRGGFAAAFKEIVVYSQDLLQWSKEHKEDLMQMVNRGWLVMKGVIETVINLFRPLLASGTSFRELVDETFRGLGYIAYAVLPVLGSRMGDIAAATYEWVKLISNGVRMLWDGLSFNWEGVKAAWADIQQNFAQAGIHAGKAFHEGFLKEIGGRAFDFDKKFETTKKNPVKTPNLGDGPLSEDEKKAAAKLAEEWAKVSDSLRLDISTHNLDPLDQELEKLAAKAEQLQKKFGDKPLIAEWLKVSIDRTLDAEINKLDKDISALEEKRAEGEAEWEEALKRRAAAAQTAREAEINYQLALIDTQEQFLQLGKGDATEQRLTLTRDLLATREQFAAGIDRRDTTGWNTQQQAIQDTRDRLLELEFQLQEQTGSIGDGLDYGIRKFLNDAQTLFQGGTEIAQRTAQGMEGAFSTFFFDAMTGKIESLWDYIQGFLESVVKAVADVMAQVVAQQLITAAMPDAGGLSFVTAGPQTMIMHSGGLVPRFHFGGLASDEVPAILQTGERVLSREQNELFERFSNKAGGSGDVNITLINQTGQPITARALPPRADVRGLVREISLELADTDPTYRSRFNIR